MYSDDETVTMLSKYNLHVGNQVADLVVTPLASPTGKQDKYAIGYDANNETYGGTSDNPYIGTTAFSSTKYWSSNVSTYPAYVYDSNSTLYTYVENYKNYLTSLGAIISDARLIKVEELETLGCSMSEKKCKAAPKWVYSTSYWSGSANDASYVWRVLSDNDFDASGYNNVSRHGLRPVISISKSLF